MQPPINSFICGCIKNATFNKVMQHLDYLNLSQTIPIYIQHSQVNLKNND